MRNLPRSFAYSALLTLPLWAACGGEPPKAVVPVPNAVPVEPPHPTPVASARASLVPPPRDALDKLVQLGVRGGADLALVVDGDKLRASLAKELLIPVARISREIFDAICGISPLEDIVRGAGSYFAKPERIYAAFETKHPARDWVRCASRVMKATPVEEGHEVPEEPSTFIEVREIRIEARDEHTLVISPAGEGAVTPNFDAKFSSLTLSGDAIAQAKGDLPVSSHEIVRNIHVDFGGNASSLNARASFDLPDGKGVEVTEKLNEARARLGSKNAAPPVAWLFDRLHYTIQGDHVEGSISVDQSDVRDIASFIALFLGGGTREYPSYMKADEARVTLTQLTRLAVMRTEMESADPKDPTKSIRLVNCPPTTPLTPAKVPRGVTYQSTAADWQKPGWKALRFSMSDPQRYSYGINTTADGKSCTFYAIGDLNGNGKTSRFELKAQVRAQPIAPSHAPSSPNKGPGAKSPPAEPQLWVTPRFVETAPNE